MISRRSQSQPIAVESSHILGARKESPESLTLTCLLELLQIHLSATTCYGTTTKQKRCTVKLSKANQQKITPTLNNLLQTCNSNDPVSDLLLSLSELLLCPRYHRSQATTRVAHWEYTLAARESVQEDKDSNTSSKSSSNNTPGLSSISSGVRRSRIVKDNTEVQSKNEENRETTRLRSSITSPRTSTASESRTRIDAAATDGELPKATTSIPAQAYQNVSERTRSRTTNPIPPIAEELGSAFEPYSKVLTASYSRLLQKLEAPISKGEKKDGWVYIFKRPGNDTMVKIGTTTNHPAKRLQDIGKPCHYTPILLFAIFTPNAMKVERLIHCYFNRERRRENLRGGQCNEGKGCNQRHQEWFEVDVAYARGVVGLWGNWMKTEEPYDENGVLTTHWLARLRALKHTQSNILSYWQDFAAPEKAKDQQQHASKIVTKLPKVKSATEQRSNEAQDGITSQAIARITCSTKRNSNSTSASQVSSTQSMVASTGTETINRVSRREAPSILQSIAWKEQAYEHLAALLPRSGLDTQVSSLIESDHSLREIALHSTSCIGHKQSSGRTIAAC